MRRPVTVMNRDSKLRCTSWSAMKSGWLLGAACAAVLATGCSVEPAQFSLNMVYLHTIDRDQGETDKAELDDNERENIATILDALYGTPDAPRLPALADAETLGEIVELSKLERAAGPTGRDDPQGGERGLYRKHCIHCHGVNGDGAGPTAQYLNPYPRDYRMGKFKFKSTLGPNNRPTHDDLKRVLVEGIPGTAMPSFKVLDDGEIEALVHYVKYLALRGETERYLIREAKKEADLLYLDPQKPDAERITGMQEEIDFIVSKWAIQSSEVPPPPVNWEGADSVARGRQLFMSKGICHQCHGISGLGDANRDIFDDWTKDFMGGNGVGIESYQPLRTYHRTGKPGNTGQMDSKQLSLLEEFEARGALKVRPLKPRNLRRGVYRGGRRPVDLFRRVRNGILGYMPGAPQADSTEAKVGLVDDDVWHIVAYVRSLPFEKITEPNEEIRFQRDLP